MVISPKFEVVKGFREFQLKKQPVHFQEVWGESQDNTIHPDNQGQAMI